MNKKELSIWVVIGFFFVSGMTMLILAINGVFGITENLNGYVANIAKYDSIGVSAVNNSTTNSPTLSLSANRLNLATNESQKTMLTGVVNGNVEAVRFDNNGIYKVPDMNIRCFNQTSRYIFIEYCREEVYNLDFNNFNSTPNSIIYIIDKETNLTFRFPESFYLGAYNYGATGVDCGDFVVFRNFNSQSYSKLGVVDGRLEIREILDISAFPGSITLWLSDIYGNSIVEHNNNSQSTFYILNNADQLLPLDYILDVRIDSQKTGTTFRAVDGKIYNGATVLNENGEFVPADYVPERYVLPTETLIYSDEGCSISY